MNTVPKVLVPDLAGLVTLVGEPGNSYVIDGPGKKRLLKGKFAAEVAGHRSAFIDVGASTEVTEQGGSVTIHAARKLSFTFTPRVVIQPHPDGPWLAFQRAWLIVEAKAKARVLFSLDEAAISLFPDLPFAADGKLHFPTAGGVEALALGQDSSGSYFGNFVRPLVGGGFEAIFGGTASSVTLDPHAGLGVVIAKDARISFAVDIASDEIRRTLKIQDADSVLGGIKVTAHPSTGVRLDHPLGDGRTGVQVETLEIGGGWLSATELHASEKRVSIARIQGDDVTDATKIVGPGSRVRFHMPLMKKNGSPVLTDGPHFVYRDSSVEKPGGKLVARERHDGLRIRGLRSECGGPVTLDASRATVTLRGGKLEFAAGGELRVRGRRQASLLVPKPDHVDPKRRTLVVPANVGELRCEAPLVPVGDSPIVFATHRPEAERLRMRVVMEVQPAGTPGVDGTVAEKGAPTRPFVRWAMQLPESALMAFRVTDDGVFPAAGAQWPDAFTGANQRFGLVDYPGSGLELNPTTSALAETAACETKVTTFGGVIGQAEQLVYRSYCAAMVLKDKAIAYFDTTFPVINDDRVIVRVENLEDDRIFKDRRVDGLLAVYCDDKAGGPGDAMIKKFVDDNHAKPDDMGLAWPLAMGLAVLLRDRTGKYAPEIARARGAERPGMAIDSSSIGRVEFEYFGWNSEDYDLFKQDPLLWPHVSGRTARQLDPYDFAWRGILMRDLPLILPIPKDVQERVPPWAMNFYEGLNSRLLLDFGWKDENGATWSGGFSMPEGKGLSIAPPGEWQKVLDIRILKFATRGAAGRLVGAGGEVSILVPGIADEASGEPFSFSGAFSVSLAEGIELERIELAPASPKAVATKSVPGFDSVELVRFSTDLATMQMTLRLNPSAALATVIPFLGGGQGFDVTAAVPLAKNASGSWSLTLRSEITTRLFGRWPMTIQGATLDLSGGGKNRLVLRMRLNFGLPGFDTIGGRLVLQQDGGEWSFDVELDQIAGSIGVGDFHVSGVLTWSTNKEGTAGAVAGSALGAAKERDFWGDVTLDTGGLIRSDAKLLLRIGNKGELSYWVGALRVPYVKFGASAELREPVLLLAHHADYGGNMAKLLRDVHTSVAALVRPSEDAAERRKWLATWEPSSETGTLVAGSGFLHVHDVVASAPKGEQEGDFTCLVVAGGGLFRAEATLMLFKLARARVGLAVDLPHKYFSAGIQLPEFAYGAFTVRAGVIGFGLGWGEEPRCELSVGWPEPINGDVMNRDWSRSVMIRWDGAFPLNTFWGGMRAKFEADEFVLGFALRAGWTWEYKVSVANVAKGSASLLVALGGTVEVRFGPSWTGAMLPTGRPRALASSAAEELDEVLLALEGQKASEPELLATLRYAAASAVAFTAATAEANVSARVIYYADISGKASAELFGVTLAAIDVGAHAAFLACVNMDGGTLEIVRLTTRLRLHLSVKIGCVTVRGQAEIDVTIRDTGKPCFPSSRPSLLQEALT